MDFSFDTALPVLRQTPRVVRALLADMPGVLLHASEGEGTWTPYQVLGHLIHCERADWMPRVDHLLTHGDSQPFAPFDREAMLKLADSPPLSQLLDRFAALRASSLSRLESLRLAPADLARPGLHPELGPVTLGQLLSTWVAHDMSHLSQIARVVATQYDQAVGPWKAYLSILQPRQR